MENNVQIGDYVLLKGVLNENIDIRDPSGSNSYGFMSAVGFTNNDVYFEKIQCDKLKLNQTEQSSGICYLRNWQDLVFQIWPKLNHEAHKQMKRVKKQINQLQIKKNQVDEAKLQRDQVNYQQDEEPQGSQDPLLIPINAINSAELQEIEQKQQLQQEFLEDLLKQLQEQEQKVNQERENNMDLINKENGSLTYGQQIFLMHADSQMFLCGTVQASESDKSAYRFELSKNFGRQMIFKIMPKFKFRQEGEKIQYCDQVYIHNSKVNSYINFSTNMLIEIDQPIKDNHIKEPYYRSIDVKKNQDRLRYECFLSSDIECTWQLLINSTNDKLQDKIIKAGDLVQIRHTELNGYIASDYKYMSNVEENFIRRYRGEFKEELQSINMLWQIEIDDFKARGSPVEVMDKDKLKKIRGKPPKKVYKLRHFLTGKLMTLKEIKIDNKIFQSPCLTTDDQDHNKPITDIYFISTTGDKSKFMQNKHAFLILLNKQVLVSNGEEIRITQRKQQMGSKQIKFPNNFNEVSEDMIYDQLQEDEFDIEKLILDTQKPNDITSLEEHAFFIEKIDQSYKDETLFIYSTLSIFMRFIDKVKIKKIPAKDIIKKVIKSLTDLIFFIVETDQTDPLEAEGISIIHRQRIVKDCKIIEICMDILYYPFKVQMFELDRLVSVDKDMILIFKLTYKLINLSIKEYRPNELYASQWLDLLIYQSSFCDSQIDIGAETTLTELIDNNKKILEDKIKSETVEKFVQMLIERKEDKYVKLIRALTVCDEDVMVKNQSQISSRILENEDIKNKLIFPIFGEVDNILIASPYEDGENLKLKDFQQISMDKDNGTIYQFQIQMIQLLSELCQERNYTAINPLEKSFPYELCFQIIKMDKMFGSDLRQAFTKLIITLWIDRDPYNKIILPQKIRVWTEIEDQQNKINCSVHDADKFKDLLQYINDYLTKIMEDFDGHYYQSACNKETNQFTYAVLLLAKTCLEFGFYHSEKEINELLTSSLQFLNGTFDITNADEKNSFPDRYKDRKRKQGLPLLPFRYKVSENTLILHDIKERCCMILLKVIEIRDDLRLSKFFYLFKQDILKNGLKQPSKLALEEGKNDGKSSKYLAQEEDDQKLIENQKTKKEGGSKSIFSKITGGITSNLLGAVNFLGKGLFGSDEKDDYDKQPIDWMEKIIKTKDIDLMASSKVDLISVLLDLALYQKPSLVDIAYKCVNNMFSQRINFTRLIQQIQLVEDEKTISNFIKIQELVGKLRINVEKSEEWMFKKDFISIQKGQETYDIFDTLDQLLGIQLQDKRFNKYCIDKLDVDEVPADTELIVMNREKLMPTFRSHYGEEVIWSELFKESETNNTINQTLFRNSLIYHQIIVLISFDAETHTQFRNEDKNFQDKSYYDTTVIHTQVLRKAYKILGRFVSDSFENQDEINQYLEDVFLVHAKTYPEIYVSNLLKPLFKDNKEILKNPECVRKVITVIIETVGSRLRTDPQLAASYIECLGFIVEYKGKILKENQNLIMTYLCSLESKYVMITIKNQSSHYKSFMQAQDNLLKAIKKNQKGVTEIGGILDYFNQQMLLLCRICEELNNQTESKAQGYFSLDLVATLILRTCKNNFYTKNCLFRFFYDVYLDTERDMNDELKDIKKELINEITSDMINISENLGENNINIKNFKGLTNYQKVKEDYFFETLLLCAHTVIQKKLIKDDEMKIFGEQVITALFNMSEQTSILATKQKDKIRNILSFMVGSDGLGVKLEDLKNKFDKQFVPNNNLIKDTKRKSTFSAITLQKNVVITTSLKANILQKRIAVAMETSYFKKLCQDELRKMVNSICFIETQSEISFDSVSTISFINIAKSIIDFITTENKSTEQLTITRIKVLRYIIELENKESTNPAAEWDTEDYIQYEYKIIQRQNQLVELGAVKMIVHLFKKKDISKETRGEIILFSIALLLGGNLNAQEAFYEEMQLDIMNEFLIGINEMIIESFGNMKKSMGRINKKFFESIIHSDDKDELQVDEEEEEEVVKDLDNEEHEKMQDDLEPEDAADLKIIKRSYRLLQLFCEGHNLKMQNYLRCQKINNLILARSINFIFSSTIIFSNFVKFVNVYCVDCCGLIQDFLIESIQGPCLQNQIELIQGKIIDTCKDFLYQFIEEVDYKRFGFLEQEDKDDINQVVTKSSVLLLSLIEGSPSQEIFDQLNDHLDMNQLLKILTRSYNHLKGRIGTDSDDIDDINGMLGTNFDDELMDAFNIFLLLSALKEKNNKLKLMMDFPINENAKALSFFFSHLGSIEILFQEQLVRVFFPIQPICRMISQTTRRATMQKIPRDNANEKIEALMEQADELYDEMIHFAYLKSLPFNFSAARLDLLRDLSTIIGFIINLTMIATYTTAFADMDGEEDRQTIQYLVQVDVFPAVTLIRILGLVQLGTSSAMMFFWFVINGHLIKERQWRVMKAEYRQQRKDQIFDENLDMDQDIDSLSSQQATELLMAYGPQASIFNKTEDIMNFGNGFTKMQYYWVNIKCLLSEGLFRYMVFYIAVSITGAFVSEIVYCFHLLDVIGRFPTLQNVIKSVTVNIEQLGLTTFLALIIIYIYSLLAFYFVDDTYVFLEVYNSAGQMIAENQCTTLLQCFIINTNFGLIAGGGIGDMTQAQPYNNDNLSRWWLRWLIDLSFFMLIKMAILNIIFGVIIDTFACIFMFIYFIELRDENKKIENDSKNFCFICGQERAVFDRLADGFEPHIENEHQLWFYIYYVYHVLEKDSNDHNGIESYIKEQYSGQEYNWFPFGRSISIQVEEENDIEKEVQKDIDYINHEIDKLTDKLTVHIEDVQLRKKI